jgi:hypothetical protein
MTAISAISPALREPVCRDDHVAPLMNDARYVGGAIDESMSHAFVNDEDHHKMFCELLAYCLEFTQAPPAPNLEPDERACAA